MQLKQENLPQRWQEKIQIYLKETGSKYNEFSANDFHHDLKITFEDESYRSLNMLSIGLMKN